MGDNNLQASGKQKKLTARERIAAIMDEGSFVELDKHVQRSNAVYGFDDKSAPGEGIIAGWGSIEGRPVFVCAQDYSVLKGSCGTAHADKAVKLLGLAKKTGQPVVMYFDSLGARVQEGAAALDAYARIMKGIADISGVVPTIAVAAGELHGTAAMIPALFDFTLAVDGCADVSLRIPAVLCAAEGKDINPVGDAKALFEKTGLSHVFCIDEADCAAKLKRLLSFLPSNNLDTPPFYEEDFFEIAPEGLDFITSLVDSGDFFELQSGFAADMITGLAHIGSQAVGVVANRPGSFITVNGCRKAARFIRIMDAYDIPILTIADNDGVDADMASEQGTLISDISKLAYAYGEAGAPMVTLITGKAIGEGYTLMGAKHLGADVVYAYPTAQISCMSAKAGAFAMFHEDISRSGDGAKAKAEAAEKYMELFGSPISAAQQGLVDDIIEPANAKAALAAAFDMLAGKREQKPAKKHGVMPL